MTPFDPTISPLSPLPRNTSPSRRRVKRKDPIGKAVFYPHSFHPPHRTSLLPPTPISPSTDLPPCSKYRRRIDLEPEPRYTTSVEDDEDRRHVAVQSDPGCAYGALGLDIPIAPTSSFSIILGTQASSRPLAPFSDTHSNTSLFVDTSFAQQTYAFPPRSPQDTSPPHPLLSQAYHPTPTSSEVSSQHALIRRDSLESTLTRMMQGWNAFSPTTPARLREPDDPQSATSIQIVSPEDVSTYHYPIDEVFLEDQSPSQHRGLPSRDSPYLQPSTKSPIISRATHLFASPGHVSPPTPSRGLPPPRQALWGRRASAPMIFHHPTTSPRSPLAFLPPALPLSGQLVGPTEGFPFPHQPDSDHLDVFSPNYSLQPSNFPPPATEDYFGPLGRLPEPHTAPAPLPPIVEQEPKRIPGIAEQYLTNRPLDPEFVKRYTIGDELGAGGFGFVCVGTQTGYENEAGKEVAVKFVFKSRMSETHLGIPSEAFVLQQCRHPGIIGIYGLYEDIDFFYLILELHGDPWAPGHTLEQGHAPQSSQSENAYPLPIAPMTLHLEPRSSHPTPEQAFASTFGGSMTLDSPVASSSALFASPLPMEIESTSPDVPTRPMMGRRASHDLFEAVENRRFTEEQARHIFRQIVDVVFYLHSRKIYHRDLKDENIVMDSDLTVKIIDFGSAVVEDTDYPVAHDVFRGTMNYAPPEVLTGHAYHAGPSDIWCLGILLAIILTGESCFPNQHWTATGQMKIKRPISRLAFDLMMLCLTPDPRSRPTIDTIAAHPWFFGPLGEEDIAAELRSMRQA